MCDMCDPESIGSRKLLLDLFSSTQGTKLALKLPSFHRPSLSQSQSPTINNFARRDVYRILDEILGDVLLTA